MYTCDRVFVCPTSPLGVLVYTREQCMLIPLTVLYVWYLEVPCRLYSLTTNNQSHVTKIRKR